jgi:hypothetical protein
MSQPPPWHARMLPKTAGEVTFIVKAFADAPRGRDVPLIHRGADIGVAAAGDGVDYLYAKRHLLVADTYLDQVLDILGRPGTYWLGPGDGDGKGDGDGGGDEKPPERDRDEEPAEAGEPEPQPEPEAPAERRPEPEQEEVGLRRVIAGVVLLVLPPALADRDRDGDDDKEGDHDRVRGRSVPEWLDLIDERLGRGAATPDQVLTVAGNGGATPCPATDPEHWLRYPHPPGRYRLARRGGRRPLLAGRSPARSIGA